MTAPKATPVQRSAMLARGMIHQVSAITEDAARCDDAGRWGVDGWIRLIHNVVDFWVRVYAAGVDITLAGPSWWSGSVAVDPGPSEPVDVPQPVDYPLNISIAKPFTRVGRGDVVIPDHAITFVPAVLPAGATSFQVHLTDERYLGASYTGSVRLRRDDGAGRESQELTFTVGL